MGVIGDTGHRRVSTCALPPAQEGGNGDLRRSGWIRIDFRTQWSDPEIAKNVAAQTLTVDVI